jgi:hypothetical protein
MRKILAAVTLSAGLTALSPSSQAALIYGSNVIVNGDAEASAGGNGFVSTPPSGWINSASPDGINTVFYGAPSGYPLVTDPGPADRGLNFFGGTTSNPFATLTQTLDISNVSASIDAGLVSYIFSGFLGGFATQADYAFFSVAFLDGASGTISTATLGPVTNADRGNLTGLLERSSAGFIPVGTRELLFTLTSQRFEGTANDGYADNLSFIAQGPLGETPLPAALPLFATGLGVLGFVAHRRRRKQIA